MMKKITFLLLIVSSVFLVSCVKKSGKKADVWDLENPQIKVLSTTAMIGDIVHKVGGDKIQHITLITGDVDPHSYELVKGDDEKIDFSDLLFYNGLGLEHGASLHYRLEKHPHSIALGDRVLQSQKDLFITVDTEIDPHIWMDVSLWMKAIPVIVEALSKKSPENASFFVSNAEALEEKLQKLDHFLYKLFQSIPEERRYLVTSHDAFNYFTKRYLSEPADEDWKVRFQAPEGLAPDNQLSLNDLSRIIDHLCKYKIPVVFPECNLSRDALKKISTVCAKKGHQVIVSEEALFGDTMGGIGSGAESYMKMMEHNGKVISNYLLQERS